MFTFSFNRDDVTYPSRKWQTVVGEMSTLSRAIKIKTSPIIWREGIRSQANFNYADLMALDADDGKFTLADALEEFKDYAHVIGTTKSHGIAKGDAEPCDRFRVYLQLDQRVTDLKLFKYIGLSLALKYNCDLNPVDGARVFQPSLLVSTLDDGKLIDVEYYKVKQAREEAFRRDTEKEEQERRLGERKKYFGTRCLPQWCIGLLTNGVGPGESRNKACYKLGIYGVEAGYSISEIVDLIMNSAIPVGPQVRQEVERSVKSGAAKAMLS
jgi:hypothetical protein